MPDLSEAMPPKDIVAKLSAAGVKISERRLREKARALGACRIIGNVMFLLPEDIAAVFEAAKPEPRVHLHHDPINNMNFAEIKAHIHRKKALEQKRSRNKHSG